MNIARETAISIAFNMAFTAAFFALVFGFSAPAPIGGAGGLAVDFLPQSFMVALMGSLVPSLVARAKCRAATPTVGRIVVHSLTTALLVMIVTAAASWLLVAAASTASLAPSVALAVKLGFAAALAAIVTPLTLRRLRICASR